MSELAIRSGVMVQVDRVRAEAETSEQAAETLNRHIDALFVDFVASLPEMFGYPKVTS